MMVHAHTEIYNSTCWPSQLNQPFALQDLLQSWGYMRINNTQCGQQVTGDLPTDFFTSAWQTYDG